jgi:adenylate cyclase
MAEQHQTFLFADISGYSRLSEIGGDEVAAELALRFADAVAGIAGEHGAEVVKQVGDGMMLRGEAAADMVRLGLRLNGELAGLPPIHAGIHTGPAIPRGGDWWGTTVNVTARVADAAEEGQLLITEATRSAAGELDSARLRGLGPLHMKNISSPVRVYAASNPTRGTVAGAKPARRERTTFERGSQLPLFDRDWFGAGSLAFEV